MCKAQCRVLEAFVLVLVVAASAAAAQGLYLHVIPATAPAEVVAQPEAPLRVALTLADPETLGANLLAALGASVAEGRVVFDLGSYPQLAGPADEAHRASSFLVDFDEPPVRALGARLAERYGEAPSVEEIRRFTEETITVKSVSRGWDLASQVARHGEGDCTEHAVLFTALARSAGWPARVAVGVVLVWHGGTVGAYGHAWSEVHDGERWRPVDATGIDRGSPVRYVPLGVVESEGSGFQLALMAMLVSTWPQKVELSRVPAGER